MLPKRTLNVTLLLVLVAGTVAVRVGPFWASRRSGCGVAGRRSGRRGEDRECDERRPASVAENATIYDLELDAEGNFVVLREGSNGWSCSPRRPRDAGSTIRCASTKRGWTWLVRLRRRRGADHRGAGVGLHAAGRQRCQQHRSLRHRAGRGRGVGELAPARHVPAAGGPSTRPPSRPITTPVDPGSCGQAPPTSTS